MSTASADIVGRLLLVQQFIDILPDNDRIADFLDKSAQDIPGVENLKLFISGHLHPPESRYTEKYSALIERLRFDENAPEETDSPIVILPLKTSMSHLGYMLLTVQDRSLFEPYLDFIRNIANVVASRLETRRLIQELEESRRNEERSLQLLSRCNNALIRSESEAEFLERICRTFVEEGNYSTAFVCYLNRKGEALSEPISVTSREGVGSAEISEILDKLNDSNDRLLDRIGQERFLVFSGSDDILPRSISPEKRDHYRFLALVFLPRADHSSGVLGLYLDSNRVFLDARVLREIADDVSFGIRTLQMRQEQHRFLESLEHSMEQTVQSIAATVEIRDPYTAGHQRRVATLARKIAVKIGMPERDTKGVFIAATIHDIGKISTPAEILSKPGRLTPLEYELIQGHARIGYDIVKEIQFPWPIADMILHHHERLNGSGYPDGLSGDRISTGARIICVSDVVEAMASHRPYRPGLGIDRALAEIDEKKGILYDPEIVQACMDVFQSDGFRFET